MTNVEQLRGVEPSFQQRGKDLMAMAGSVVMDLYKHQIAKSEGYGNYDYVFHLIDKAFAERGYEVEPAEAVVYLEAQGMKPGRNRLYSREPDHEENQGLTYYPKSEAEARAETHLGTALQTETEEQRAKRERQQQSMREYLRYLDSNDRQAQMRPNHLIPTINESQGEQ